MTQIKALLIDASTGEVTERPLTPEEISERKAINEQLKLQQDEQDSKMSARQSALSKLAELGLTEEEIAAL
jgi:DNA-binding NarL/FixJ family response regulator